MVDSIVGPIPDTWQYLSLGEVCQRSGGGIQTGPFGSQLHASDYVETGIPSIMPQNIGDNRVLEEGIARISEDDAKRLSRYRVRVGDIVYSRRGDVRRRALIRHAESGWLCGTGCLRVRFGDESVDPRYASFYLGHPLVQEWIERHAHGATMPNLNTSILGEVPFVLPPLPEQRIIADNLTALDDKIELNRRMSQTLEEIARTLFKSWFVYFDPVHAKAAGREPVGMDAATAALFPSEFEESKLGLIPKGWNVGDLSTIASEVRDQATPGALPPETPYIGLEHMPRYSTILDRWGETGAVTSSKWRFRSGDVLFGKLRPYFHKVGFTQFGGICSTDIVVIRPKAPTWLALTLFLTSSEQFVAAADAGSTGTRMPRTNWNRMAEYKLALPPTEIRLAFSAQVNTFLSRISMTVNESDTLLCLRNALIPRLMSGNVPIYSVPE